MVLTDGLPLHTTAFGDAGSRVVFLHGLFGQGRNWTQVGKALAHPEGAPPHRALLVDLPHHGRSGWEDHFDYLRVADQVAGLLDADDPVALVGHSLGGKVAMVLALRHPELVARLCVVDVSPVAYDSGREFVGYIETMRGVDLTVLDRREQADEALREAVPNATVRSFLLQNLRRTADGWQWQLNLDLLGDSMSQLVGWPGDRLGDASYDGAVLWIGGAGSDYVGDDHGAEMDRRFPRNRRVMVKGAGHWVHSEQPQVFLEVLRRFLAQGSAPQPR